jgi:hypothetical protein
MVNEMRPHWQETASTAARPHGRFLMAAGNVADGQLRMKRR